MVPSLLLLLLKSFVATAQGDKWIFFFFLIGSVVFGTKMLRRLLKTNYTNQNKIAFV